MLICKLVWNGMIYLFSKNSIHARSLYHEDIKQNTLSLVSPSPPLIMIDKNEATRILQTNCDEQKTLCTHLTVTWIEQLNPFGESKKPVWLSWSIANKCTGFVANSNKNKQSGFCWRHKERENWRLKQTKLEPVCVFFQNLFSFQLR